MKIFVANSDGVVRDSFLTKKAREKLECFGDVSYNNRKHELSKGDLIDKISNIDILCTGWGSYKLDKDVLDAAKNLKLHCHIGGSVASYVTPYVFERGIKVLSGNDIFAKSVAEGCLLYMLFAMRKLDFFIDNMRQKGWRDDDCPEFNGIAGKKIGIIGYGMIAKYLCEMLKPFDIKLSIFSSHISEDELNKINARRASLEEIFSECDIISLHNALNEKTESLIDGKLLSKIKKGGLLVNTARAHIVDEQSLLKELKKNSFNAILDVHYKEPLPLDSEFRGLHNVILLPHMCGPTIDARERVGLDLVDDIGRFIKGEKMKNEVDFETAKRMTVEKG